MHEDNDGTEMYFIRHGEVEISVQGETIETLNDGDYFGQCSVLIGAKRLYSARALIPCDVLLLPGNEITRIIHHHEKIRPVLEHGTVDRLIRIYNRCRLFNNNAQDYGALHNAHEPHNKLAHNKLASLFKQYLEHLAGTKIVAKDNVKKQYLTPTKKSNELETLLKIVVEKHRKIHLDCDISASLIKEIYDTNVSSLRGENDDTICDLIVSGILQEYGSSKSSAAPFKK